MKQLVWIITLFLFASSCSNSKNTEANAIPICIQGLIKKNQKQEKQNPPIKIYSYTYQGMTVYYETAPCCDMFSNLYSKDCGFLGHPDGGITGRGDGQFPDFDKMATNEKLVWEDKR